MVLLGVCRSLRSSSITSAAVAAIPSHPRERLDACLVAAVADVAPADRTARMGVVASLQAPARHDSGGSRPQRRGAPAQALHQPGARVARRRRVLRLAAHRRLMREMRPVGARLAPRRVRRLRLVRRARRLGDHVAERHVRSEGVEAAVLLRGARRRVHLRVMVVPKVQGDEPAHGGTHRTCGGQVEAVAVRAHRLVRVLPRRLGELGVRRARDPAELAVFEEFLRPPARQAAKPLDGDQPRAPRVAHAEELGDFLLAQWARASGDHQVPQHFGRDLAVAVDVQHLEGHLQLACALLATHHPRHEELEVLVLHLAVLV
mmetsp:Transcript_8722/g.19314  ORF Transcript_8722/g.19314 Transcript_8722/m.19314 type:complete len:318 (-) Transcript_8722:422-1375(-)